jgi:hypothetical protein
MKPFTLFNDVQGFLDILSESHIAEIITEADGLDHSAQLMCAKTMGRALPCISVLGPK